MLVANQIEDVDVLLFQSKNLTKKKQRRMRMIFFLIIMLLFVSLELSVNGKCFLNKTKQKYFYVDIIMYFGVILIAVIEIIIQQKKIHKKFQQQVRLRAQFCQLIIYSIFISSIVGLSLYHILVQVYYFSLEFNQECFYFRDDINNQVVFATLKTIIFLLFIIVEGCIITFLIWVLKENEKAYQNPQKFKESVALFRSMSNDIVLQIK
ncbi:unnamed protein product [Paramecium sonneborni]|uniref:Transmembrane protein n=1 Tax=Paramecium sonneborni TaxID=65129 RepID=A0A8S1QQ69_9CILI|nr:unnamed protein product [Paramecium sonneborni]